VERHLWASLGELPCLAHLVLEVPQEVLTAQASQPHPSPPTAAAVAAPAVDGKWQVRWQLLHCPPACVHCGTNEYHTGVATANAAITFLVVLRLSGGHANQLPNPCAIPPSTMHVCTCKLRWACGPQLLFDF
jgi:hypothetical protein